MTRFLIEEFIGVYLFAAILSWGLHKATIIKMFLWPHAPELTLIPKDDSWFMKVLAFLYRPLGDFMSLHTTIGNRCYLARGFTDLDHDDRVHEETHAAQAAQFGFGSVWLGMPLFAFLYLFAPLPIGLAWFRYRFELEAYLAQGMPAERIVDYLSGKGYGWAWPRAWVTRDLFKALGSGYDPKNNPRP